MVTTTYGRTHRGSRVASGVSSSQEGADCFGGSRVTGRRRVLRKTSGSDKDVYFRRAPRGDWDAYQSGGYRIIRRAPGKRRRRVTIMLSWIIREFLRVWWPTQRISLDSLSTGYACTCPITKFQLGKYYFPRHSNLW